MSLQNRKARPVPLVQYEDYGDIPPEGMDIEEVELIWWTVASRMSNKELRKRLKKVADGYRDAGCLRYAAISDVQGRGRYPRGVINAVKQVLKPRGLMPLDTADDVLYIQVEIWHLCISKALEWCPPNALPRKLRGIKVEADLGL
ncbi:hypothetical protein [Pseudomonas sp. CFBP 13727]|uniref:hypothetical protein n=1 Tax=Pseudomonas sp. CFBP 13727 TaxID=2775295 RepID=UPI00177A7AD2|nr:hypothetical protein [Pseudomonas sp. CFBP 13727]MBD8623428.1 hypothetical protein [Pseudomonas sp. CFBP 13727]